MVTVLRITVNTRQLLDSGGENQAGNEEKAGNGGF